MLEAILMNTRWRLLAWVWNARFHFRLLIIVSVKLVFNCKYVHSSFVVIFPFCGGGNNRSPKGNMWSAIPVALLCMIVNCSERKQGSGPEGDDVL